MARIQLAESLGDVGRFAEAQAQLAEVTRLDPQHPRAWFLRGRYAILEGDPRRARDDFLVRSLVVNRRLGDLRGWADALNAMGVAAQQMNQWQEAMESCARASLSLLGPVGRTWAVIPSPTGRPLYSSP